MITQIYRGFILEFNPDTGLFLVGMTKEDKPQWMKCREGFNANIGQYVLVTPIEDGYEIVRDDPMIREIRDNSSLSASPN